MVEYNERILQRYAERLNSRANRLVVLFGLLGTALGFMGAQLLFPGGQPLNPVLRPEAIGAGLLGAVALGMIGEGLGFRYRLEAQRTLCQVQVERNTRKLVQVLADLREGQNGQPEGFQAKPGSSAEAVGSF